MDIKHLFTRIGSETSRETWLGEETRMKKLIVIPVLLLVGCAGTECQYSDTIAEAVDAYCEATTQADEDEAKAQVLSAMGVAEVVHVE